MVSLNTEDRDNETPDLDYLGGIYDGRGRVPYCIGKSQSNDAADFGDCVEASGGGREEVFAFSVKDEERLPGWQYSIGKHESRCQNRRHSLFYGWRRLSIDFSLEAWYGLCRIPIGIFPSSVSIGP